MGEPGELLCPELARLNELVQDHLRRIAELSRGTAKALQDQNYNVAQTLDHEVELEIGAKERALGALKQHRQEHGC